MSETTSFLGGAALAGLAAVTLLKGGVSATAPSFTSPQIPVQPYPTATMPSLGVPSTTAAPTVYDLEKQRVETEQLKAQFEQQRVQTEQLKAQIQSQQTLIETLNAQSKNNGVASISTKALQGQPLNSEQASNPMMTGILWALGGMLLAFGGGLALVGVFVLFARQQRPSRTIEVIHDEYPNYLPARRKSQVLPPRRTIKRVDADDWE
ncbi:MAG: DUF3450 domain-containing protein [Phormidesmis sp. CAN_BIN36]|nr:DUF3450 domain-containing protein [Phormidesmis sp. CAN_BIN36]